MPPEMYSASTPPALAQAGIEFTTSCRAGSEVSKVISTSPRGLQPSRPLRRGTPCGSSPWHMQRRLRRPRTRDRANHPRFAYVRFAYVQAPLERSSPSTPPPSPRPTEVVYTVVV